MIHEARYNIFESCVTNYDGDMPLSKFLKAYFNLHKNMGSKDRKHLSTCMYSYFRCARAFPDKDLKTQLLLSLLLCDAPNTDFIKHHLPDAESLLLLSKAERQEWLQAQHNFKLEDIFPLHHLISNKLNNVDFLQAQLQQPDLFLRAVRGREQALEAFLQSKEIKFEREEQCFRLANQSNIPEAPQYLFEVQDASSQQTQKWMHPAKDEYWWDCCAGSGGKSLLLKEVNADCYLMCSDVRETILKNLDERLRLAGISKYKRRLIDLCAEIQSFEKGTFDGIVMDAPCTGSGTWARTPERVDQVDDEKVQYFTSLQRSMADNAVQFLKKGKPFLYITCSVFAAENEEVVDFLVKEHKLTLQHMQYIEGYGHKADTMFIAVMIPN
jgi:16S rRNA (cytosine967-C5)-methyltransferase